MSTSRYPLSRENPQRVKTHHPNTTSSDQTYVSSLNARQHQVLRMQQTQGNNAVRRMLAQRTPTDGSAEPGSQNTGGDQPAGPAPDIIFGPLVIAGAGDAGAIGINNPNDITGIPHPNEPFDVQWNALSAPAPIAFPNSAPTGEFHDKLSVIDTNTQQEVSNAVISHPTLAQGQNDAVTQSVTLPAGTFDFNVMLNSQDGQSHEVAESSPLNVQFLNDFNQHGNVSIG